MAPKREIVDPAYDTLALSESDDDLDSEEIEDAPVCDDPHAALRRVSSAFDAKVAHLTSPGLAPSEATAVTLDAEVTSRLNAARAMLSKVKRALLDQLTNFGNPIIEVVDANYLNRGELYLFHDWGGVDLQFEQAGQTLRYLHEMWKRPVHIETAEEGKALLLSYDGEESSVKEVVPSQPQGVAVGAGDDDDDE